MNPVIVRNVKIGEGIPKICVPIVGRTKEEIIEEAKSLQNVPVDLVEWRVDWFENVFNFGKVCELLEELRAILKELPLLFTFRSANEGGELPISTEAYVALNQLVIESGNVDLVDVELFSSEEALKKIIACAHEKNVKVIASNHDFEKTPEEEEIISRLQKMQEAGADILKIAVMPQTNEDVSTLLSATKEMVEKYAKQPVVAISMSELGVVSRLTGELYGSAITFGAAEKTSAPGQISTDELKSELERVHNSLF